jgi:hypothetical protein
MKFWIGFLLGILICACGIASVAIGVAKSITDTENANILLTNCTSTDTQTLVQIPAPNVYNNLPVIPLDSVPGITTGPCYIDMCYVFTTYLINGTVVSCPTGRYGKVNSENTVYSEPQVTNPALLPVSITLGVVTILIALTLCMLYIK